MLKLSKSSLLLIVPLAAGCGGAQSSLNPAGLEAAQISRLFWWMTGIGLLIWAGMIALALYAIRASKDVDREPQANRLVLAGALLPAVVLALLLYYGLALLPSIAKAAPENALRIHVWGEQWWWRVRYELPDGRTFETANEIRLPVAEPVEFLLASANVIHSFWIPSLGGKMDAIPGRVNRLVLNPSRTGRFRGVCAEFCGVAHAKMTFDVVVLSPSDFEGWLRSQLDAPSVGAQR